MGENVNTQFKDILNLDFRDEARVPQTLEAMNIGGEELLHILSLFDPYGVWRLDVDAAQAFWTEDVFKIHGLEPHTDPIDLQAAIARYHPEDREYLPKLIEEATTRKTGFRFVLRVSRKTTGYKLVKATGKYRETANGKREIVGTFSEFQPANRAIAAVG